MVICGTRMFPTPKMKDVFMDLYADPEPFLHGQAHNGMVRQYSCIIDEFFYTRK